MSDASCVAGTIPESRRASATRLAPGGADQARVQKGNGNGNGPLAEAALLADEPLHLSPPKASRDPARRAAMEMASAVIVASSAETASHSDDVDVLCEAISRRLGLSDAECEEIVTAARLHDIGKVAVPGAVLEKPGPLTDAEWAAIRRHTVVGEEIVAAVPELEGVAKLVRHSHERWDGCGYPDGVSGEQIPLGSRIIACADAYHAMRSDRPYRDGRSAVAAMVELRICAGTQFDPAVVTAMEDVAGAYRNYTPRRLNGRTARLMALLLIVGVGVTGSAIARSGLLGTPTATAAAPRTIPAAGPPQSSFQRALAALGFGGGSSTLFGGGGSNVGVGANGPGALSATPGQFNPPGVRDHGIGVGAGKGQGKGQGDENGQGQGNGNPGHSGGWSGQGQSASAPGHGGTSPGKSGSSSGNANSAPGHDGSPGNSGSSGSSVSPGNSGNAGSSNGSPGNSGSTGSPVNTPPVTVPPVPPVGSGNGVANGVGNGGGNGIGIGGGNAGGNGSGSGSGQ
jgi:HD domain